MDKIQKVKLEDGTEVEMADDAPVDRAEMAKRDREEAYLAALSAFAPKEGAVVLLALRVMDAHDAGNLVLGVVGAGDDARQIVMTKRHLFDAVSVGKRVASGR